MNAPQPQERPRRAPGPEARPGPPGTVYLVGAGPGDPRQLTVEAAERIRGADVIVHDALVSEGLRDLFPPDALVIDAGKRAGRRESADQRDINRMLFRFAAAGWDVVRLKGGDPFVFGRGGEELEALRGAGIPVTVLPGITAAQAAAAAAGVALTHRGRSRSCVMLNGHRPQLDQVPWTALVALGGSWAFYMARGSAGEIARRLLAHGAAPQRRLLLVENASLPDQDIQSTTLADAARIPPTPRGDGPAMVVVAPADGQAHGDNLFLQDCHALDPLVADLARS